MMIRKLNLLVSQSRSISKRYAETLEATLNSIHREELEDTVPNIIHPAHEKLSYRVTSNKGLHLLYETFSHRIDLLAKLKPNEECFIFPYNHRRLTFLELKQRVDEFAQNLLNLGFQKGDRLAIMLPDIPEINISILACASIGVIVVLMNPAYQLVELEYMLKKTRAKGIIMMESVKNFRHYQILSYICPELKNSIKGGLISKALPDLRHVIMVNLNGKYESHVDTRFKGTWSYGELDKFNLTYLDKPNVEPEDPFVILFTVFIFILKMNLKNFFFFFRVELLVYQREQQLVSFLFKTQ